MKPAVIKWLKEQSTENLRGRDTYSHSKVEHSNWEKGWLCAEVLYSHDQPYKHIIHIHLRMHAESTTHNKDERHSLLEKYTSHFIWKVCVWEGVGDRTELHHIDPHSIDHYRVSFPFSWAAQPGAWGPTLLGAGFLYRILSPTGLVSKLTDFLSSPSYIIVQRPLLIVGVTIALIQPIHGQGYNSDIPRPDAPVIYLGAFPILTARPGRRSIYNRIKGVIHFDAWYLFLCR